jgi:circadian clock protein KaiC
MVETKSTAETFWTGLPALDQVIVPQGIPLRSLNVIGGGPGTGKTILALQMLIGEAIQTQPLSQVIETINQAIIDEDARLVVVDSFKAISDIVPQAEQLRVFAYNLAVNLVSAMCTAFLVGEYTLADMAEVPIFAIADGILSLSFRAEGLNRQRYLEVHKVRGRGFVQGLHPFAITPAGITVYPRIRTPEQFVEYPVAAGRLPTGLPRLDEMLDGGLPPGTATMVAGGAGTGKTLLGMHFITAGAARGEPGVIVTFQENPAQLRQIARAFDWDLRALEEQGLLAHLYHSPVEIQPDIHTARVAEAVQRIGARRVLVDSLKDLEIATADKVRYKDYVYSLVNEFKRQGITTLLTNEIPELFGSFSLSEFGVSFIADNVILLRYVEMGGRMGRALNVLKVRGSQHDKEIRTFKITDQGICIGNAVRAATGVLTGTPVVGADWGWRELEPGERYAMEVLRAIGPATLAEAAATTMIPSDALEPLLQELSERGYVLGYGPGDGRKYKVTL